MRKRSDVARDKSPTIEVPKPSVAARTKPMFDDAAGVSQVKCPTCEDTTPLAEWTTRADKQRECPSCAAPLDPLSAVGSAGGAHPPPAKSAKSDDEDSDEDVRAEREAIQDEAKGSSPSTEKTSPQTPDAKKNPENGGLAGYCGDCGAAWPFLNGLPHISCGHTRAVRVKHPTEATKIAVPAGQQTQNAASRTSEAVERRSDSAIVARAGDGVRYLKMTWGECGFAFASDFTNMRIGPFTISTELALDADAVLAAKRMTAELQAIAEEAFTTQKAWYEKKLGITPKR